jgi:Intron-binding protein aquarius N-terminus
MLSAIRCAVKPNPNLQVREDLADVLQRVGASWDEEQEDPVVKFRGWARMAMPLAGFDIIEVKPPKVGRSLS